MFSPLRNRFGIPGVISVIALVFAMFGGAYAATNSGGKATASKAKQGKQGKPGKPGPAGPQGPAGPAGAKGDTGAAGSNGTNGTNGTDGTSATTAAIPTSSATCNHNGGVEVKSVSPVQNVCNGETGFTETLPLNSTETGAWSLIGTEEELYTSISFNIPLPEELEASQVHLINSETGEELVVNLNEVKQEEVPQSACEGNAAKPTAEPGNFCLYATNAPGAEFLVGSNFISSPDVNTAGPGQPSGAGVSGARLLGFHIGGGFSKLWGSWAVTA
jgi:hypothetical protein